MRPLLLAAALFLAGCESLSYYGQAVGGHLSLMASARPVESWIEDPATPGVLRAQLEQARRIREFASRELALPDNRSYRAYADLGRPYAAWNVVAAPALALEPLPQCFPFAGCVAYRGFFSEARARARAGELAAAGNDVYVGGVPAYSTLGWLPDPLLSTFIAERDWQVARLLFHELAHQVVYRKGDATFNESFAVVVEEEGVRRWLAAERRGAEAEEFRAFQARRRAYAASLAALRTRLGKLYASDLPAAEKLERKHMEFERLRAEYPRLPETINNAFLASAALYTERVPEFERLLAASGSLEAFYAKAKALAASAPSSPGPSSAPSR